MIKFQWKTRGGADQLKELARKFPEKLDRALKAEADVEVQEVKRRTPVSEEVKSVHLVDTVAVEGPTVEGSRHRVEIVAGGPEAPYALYVHEDMEAFHRVGQAKFIESVLKESAPYKAQRIAARIDEDHD